MTQLPRDIRGKIATKNLTIDSRFKTSLLKQLATMEENDIMKKQLTSTKRSQFYTLFKYNFASIVVLFAALVAVGGASAFVSSNRTKQAALRETSIPTDLNDVLGVEVIRAKAAADFPEGTVTGVELDQEDEGLVYKVKFSDGSVRLYDARTGDSLVRPSSTNVEVDDSVPTDFQSKITLQEARNIAQAQRPNKTIQKIELETENGVIVYSVRFSDDGRVDVNASDGTIVRVRNGENNTTSGSTNSSPSNTSDDSSGDDSSSSTSSSDDSDEDSDDDSHNDNDDDEDDNSGSGSSNSGSGRSGRSDD